ncbi:monocarboxylate transporter 7-like [Nerophis ophidion]|uniref:monocarboxylate transporter 7-like n=1 Tax=Nerophis ophidion TaxID=159077 RepID=UPI002ADFACB9|nr:monocarboxylate transporter 7-like [Nerophis ophidion]
MLCGLRTPKILRPKEYTEVPDGGWGWVVAVAFFLVEVFTYGTIKSFGIFLQDLMEEFRESNSRVSWIVSICVFVMTFNGPLSSMLTKRFGFQLVVMFGGLLVSLGTITTSFTSSINQMYLTYGLIVGFGYCLTFLPTVTILSHYFLRRRSLVIAISSTGEALSMFALAPGLSSLKGFFGWRHTMLVIGILQGTIIFCGAVLRPISIKPQRTQETDTDRSSLKNAEDQSTHGNADEVQYDKINGYIEDRTLLEKEESTELPLGTNEEAEARNNNGEKQVIKDDDKCTLLDFSILKECSFIFYSLFGLFATLGFFGPQLYIIELSVSRGVERDRATYMLSIMAVAEILGRFLIGWVLTHKQVRERKLLVLLVCVIFMAVDLLGFTLVTEFYGLAVCCSVYGFFMGTLSCTHIPMLAEEDVVGLERMSAAAGVYVFIQSFAGLAGPPLGGVLVDITQNYGSAFYSCAAGMAVSAVFLGFVRPAKRGLLCGSRTRQLHEDTQNEVREDFKVNADVNEASSHEDLERC